MNIIKITYNAAIRRPIIIILPAVLVFILSVINSYSPLMPILLGISNATGAGFFEGIVAVLQLILDRQIIAGAAFLAAGAVLLVSLVSAIVLSGYFPIVANTLEGRGKTGGDFLEGVRKYFFRLFTITLRASLTAGLLVMVMVVAAVPAIIITRAAAVTKPELMPAAVFVDILTGMVLFFGYTFCKIYLLYWFPAAVKGLDRPFRLAKSLVDRNFFKLLARLLIFDIVLAAITILAFIIPVTIVKLLFGWVFTTAFVTVLTIFVFKSFSEIMVSDRQDDGS